MLLLIIKVNTSYYFIHNFSVCLLVIIGFVVQSYVEELLFRGQILTILLKNFNWYIISGILAFTFTFGHALNGGFTIISFVTLFSVFTKNLSFSSGFHFI
ncbi:CPBP family glutamic-type intramembrane protease [Streptococcus sp. LQJ-218]|uniref:CPBP family glutamic-type intramembrane protease n=1 Tax=Streptococcus sp. LQJ-218 TaxID=2283190 RepID=UPI001F0CA00E|nr:CPBP family glutamic-type intramembrane protease [Streptococcus sp. LQJ-218]